MRLKTFDKIKTAEAVMSGKITRIVTEVENGHVARAQPPHMTDVQPDVCFVRNDRWTLAATYEDEDAAKALWEGHWVLRIDLRTGQMTDL